MNCFNEHQRCALLMQILKHFLITFDICTALFLKSSGSQSRHVCFLTLQNLEPTLHNVEPLSITLPIYLKFWFFFDFGWETTSQLPKECQQHVITWTSQELQEFNSSLASLCWTLHCGHQKCFLNLKKTKPEKVSLLLTIIYTFAGGSLNKYCSAVNPWLLTWFLGKQCACKSVKEYRPGLRNGEDCCVLGKGKEWEKNPSK